MTIIDFDLKAVLDGTDDLALTGITDMTVSGNLLYTVSASGTLTAFRLTSAGLVEVDQASLPSSGIAGVDAELQSVTTDEGAVAVLVTGAGSGGLWSISSTPKGSLSGAAATAGGLPADLSTFTTVVRNGATYLVGTRVGSESPGLWLMNDDGSVSEASAPGASNTSAAGITAMQGLELGSKAYVIATAAGSNELVLFKVEDKGLTRKAVLGADDGVGIATPSSVVLTELDGEIYAVMGASGSSSISVVRVTADSLILTDHITDSLDTRFQNVTTVETITADGRVFIVAAGSDDGLSLFEMLPGGTLLHHAALADSTATTLDNVSDVALSLDGNVLSIAVSSASEAGLTVVSVDLPAAETLIEGGDQDEALTGTDAGDVITDGAGQDTLRGGDGGDTFVLVADGETDTITDFVLGEDSLDLSAWAFLRSVAQLTVIETDTGAEIWFNDERLVIQTASGDTLTSDQIVALDFLSVDRTLPQWSDAVTEPDEVEPEPEDFATGTRNADYMDAGSGNSTFKGKGGEDTIRGNDGDDSLYGDAKSDVLEGGDGNDFINAGQGLDIVLAGNGDDYVEGKEGHDWIEGGAGNDTLMGDSDRDTLLGGSGNDSLKGVKGADSLEGGAGDDFLSGGEGADWLDGGDGNDRIDGGVSNDTMFGGRGDDVLLSNQGSDLMYGDAGDDSMRGHDGHDSLWGGDGDDSLYGSAGRDLLDGGTGDDLLVGGSGADVFIFTGGNDTITDFSMVDSLQIDRNVWAGSLSQLLDNAEVTDAGLVLDFGPDDSLLFRSFANIDMVADALDFA